MIFGANYGVIFWLLNIENRCPSGIRMIDGADKLVICCPPVSPGIHQGAPQANARARCSASVGSANGRLGHPRGRRHMHLHQLQEHTSASASPPELQILTKTPVNFRCPTFCQNFKGAPRYDVCIKGEEGHGKTNVVREVA